MIKALTPVLWPLFRLFCAATTSKANIRGSSREIVLTYFRLSSTAAQDLTSIILPRINRPRCMCPLVFKPGDSGGLSVRALALTLNFNPLTPTLTLTLTSCLTLALILTIAFDSGCLSVRCDPNPKPDLSV